MMINSWILCWNSLLVSAPLINLKGTNNWETTYGVGVGGEAVPGPEGFVGLDAAPTAQVPSPTGKGHFDGSCLTTTKRSTCTATLVSCLAVVLL